MKKYIVLIVTIAVAILIWGATANAESSYDPEKHDELYMQDRICFVNSTYDYNDEQVVVTNFEIREGFLWGTTSLRAMPCAPLSCPNGTFIVSDNICSFTDPFAHIPIIDENLIGTVSTAELLINVEEENKIRFAEDSPFWAGLSV